ncbi:DNA repair protein RecN [Pseudopelagicola sp. nBUS_20]|uniref:DNA repair protein RecN n=1 Tax=Pseudopelagicola sp. nBUS_20 TaxID=3395317 RepID=UPI003EBD7017
MLRALDIRNMLIIDQLELEFQPGLNVLTGETGAGKSILLDSLGFVLGWRGRAELVRAGNDQGEVTATFDLSEAHPAHAILMEAGLPSGDELILRRVNQRDGRKTAWVNDRRCSGEVLRQLSATLIELHGQHDDRGILNQKKHKSFLDSFAGNDAKILKLRKAWKNLSSAENALSDALIALKKARSEEDFLRHSVAELDSLRPLYGEDAELDARRRMMQGAEKVRAEVARARSALGAEGAEGAIGDAVRWLEDALDGTAGHLEAPIAALERALVELGDAADGVDQCLEALHFNPNELEQIEERLFAIRGLARKHDVPADELSGFANDLRARLAALDAGEGSIAGLRATLDAAKIVYERNAEALTQARKNAATKLDVAVMRELTPLKMERAVFKTKVEAGAAGPDGHDLVEFVVSTNPGAPAGPLGKIASGGELSRFMLALKVCLTQHDDCLTLIFDEIDRGVGGATANAVGRRLNALADGGQVLVVTHSPQVAALAAHHWRVEKQVHDNQTTSQVVELTPEARINEIARMLSGDKITEEARAAAKSLLP